MDKKLFLVVLTNYPVRGSPSVSIAFAFGEDQTEVRERFANLERSGYRHISVYEEGEFAEIVERVDTTSY